jgi:hypothetical protein
MRHGLGCLVDDLADISYMLDFVDRSMETWSVATGATVACSAANEWKIFGIR